MKEEPRVAAAGCAMDIAIAIALERIATEKENVSRQLQLCSLR